MESGEVTTVEQHRLDGDTTALKAESVATKAAAAAEELPTPLLKSAVVPMTTTTATVKKNRSGAVTTSNTNTPSIIQVETIIRDDDDDDDDDEGKQQKQQQCPLPITKTQPSTIVVPPQTPPPPPSFSSCAFLTPSSPFFRIFPKILHEMVSQTAENFPSVIKWIQNGEAFVVSDKNPNLEGILKIFFSHGKYSSLQRQLNMYGFKKHTSGK